MQARPARYGEWRVAAAGPEQAVGQREDVLQRACGRNVIPLQCNTPWNLTLPTLYTAPAGPEVTAACCCSAPTAMASMGSMERVRVCPRRRAALASILPLLLNCSRPVGVWAVSVPLSSY